MRSKALALLLVEDDESHAEITRRNLEEFKTQMRDLVHLTNGQAALDHLETAASSVNPRRALPDLIMLDLRLPRVDGLEVLTRIKADARLKHIPVIILSTSEAALDVRACYEQGASAYLSKPAEYKQYREVIRAFGEFWLCTSRYVGDGAGG